MFGRRFWIKHFVERKKPVRRGVLRLEPLDHRIVPTTYYVTPPVTAPLTDAASLRTAVGTASDGDTIALEGGTYTHGCHARRFGRAWAVR